MKKFFYISFVYAFIIASIIATSFWQAKTISVSKNISGYAQINYSSVQLYRYPSENNDYSNKYFLLEPSYFVKLLERTNDYFYKVKVKDIVGYVKIEDVELVDNTPISPFLENIYFEIYSKTSAVLRSEPTTANGNKSIIQILPAGTKNIEYLGKISGEESLVGGGNIWYYCKITNINGTASYGYVYASLTTNYSNISQNQEQVKSVSSQIFDLSNLLYINISTQNLIVLILSLPVLLILYLFIKPTKLINKKQ